MAVGRDTLTPRAEGRMGETMTAFARPDQSRRFCRARS
jgi:hypothetical protein